MLSLFRSFNPLPHQVYLLGVSYPKNVICAYKDLSPSQKKICKDHEDQVTSVGEGVKMALAECEHQFQYRHWNCSIPKHDKHKLLVRITKQGKYTVCFARRVSFPPSAMHLIFIGER